MPPTPRYLWPALGVAAALGLSVAAYLRHGARLGAREILHPAANQPDEAPASYGLAPESVWIETPDGIRLGGWLVPARRQTDRAVALFHGHSAARSQLLPHARFLSEHYHCLLIDFRNVGTSTGDRSSMGLLESRDVAAAVNFLKARGMTAIAGFGMSMGGAALLRAMAADPSVACAITEGTFDRVASVIAKRASDRHFPIPGLLARAIVAEAGRQLGEPIAPPDPVDLIAGVAPRAVLVIHGDADQTSVVSNGLRLYEAARDPKELFVVPGAAHTRCHATLSEAYERRVLAFLARCLEGVPASGPASSA